MPFPPEKIIADLKKTGFPAEMATVECFRRAGWDATGFAAFVDRDSSKSREFDMWAIWGLDDDEVRALDLFVAAEVKSSDKPWIVFRENADDETHESLRSFGPYVSLGIPESRIEQAELAFDASSLRRRLGWVGIGIHEFDKKPQARSRSFEAMMVACKAAEALSEVVTADEDEDDDDDPYELSVARAIVVFEGELWSAAMVDGEVAVREEAMCSVPFQLRTPGYSPRLQEVDVVRLEALDEYVDLLMQRTRAAAAALGIQSRE